MRIALVCHLRFPIAEPFMGGMEAHSFRLAEALQRRGHRVTLFAAGDSDPRFEIAPVIGQHYETRYPWYRYRTDPVLYAYLDGAVEVACQRLFSGEFDVVHNNGLHRYVLEHACNTAQPVVTSLHIPPFDPLHGSVARSVAPNHRFAVVSQDQVGEWWPDAPPPEVSVVHNGIDPAAWPYEERAGAHAVWCGRITPNKGPHLAVAAAKRLGMPLRLFGFLEDRTYYHAEIAPHLGDDIVYGGLLDAQALSREMRQAAVLVFTPCWNEPFGLVLIEAMASGTPVASLDRGAVREILTPECGRIAARNDSAALAEAMRAASRLPRSGPRRRVEAAFTTGHMVSGYERLYDEAIAAGRRRREAAA